jgi:hypothetical protein
MSETTHNIAASLQDGVSGRQTRQAASDNDDLVRRHDGAISVGSGKGIDRVLSEERYFYSIDAKE